MDGHHIRLGEQVGTELQVVVEVKRPTGFEALPEVCHHDGLFLFPHTAELLVRVLRQPRRPTTTTIMM
jgi:hypothetical protein